MDLRILEIASNTENNRILDKHTHKSKNKNPMCGDEMEISLIVKNNKVIDMGYQCKSCVYCQASASLLSQNIKNKSLDEVKEFIKVQYPSNKKFVVSIHETFVTRKNLMSGELYQERYDTPSYCSPSCASYWSM